MIGLLGALGAALLTAVVGPMVRGETDTRLARRLARHAAIREKLVGNDIALQELDTLLALEARALRKSESRRVLRKVEASSVAAVVVVIALGAGIVYGLIVLALSLETRGVAYWLLIFSAFAVGAFMFGLSAAGSTTIYNYPDDTTTDESQ